MLSIEKLTTGFLVQGAIDQPAEQFRTDYRYAVVSPLDVLKQVATSLAWYMSEAEKKQIADLLALDKSR